MKNTTPDREREWEKLLFQGLFGIPLDSKPINGRTVQAERELSANYKGFDLEAYDGLVKIFEPVAGFISAKAREEERGSILEAIENAPPEAITMGWDAREMDFIRKLLSPTPEVTS